MNQWENITENFENILTTSRRLDYPMVHREVLLLFDLYSDDLQTHLPAPDLLCPSSRGNIELTWIIGKNMICVEFGIDNVMIEGYNDTHVTYQWSCRHSKLVERLQEAINSVKGEQDERSVSEELSSL